MADLIAIELNDSGIIVSDDKQILFNSPGYLINLQGREWIGEEARSRAFLHPNECNNRFWAQLDQSQPNLPLRSNAARLALRHLAFIWEQVSCEINSVILTVPASFTKTGLGLLLGICKELSIPVRAMVHHAVLAPKQDHHTGPTVHVEMQLHQTAITHLSYLKREFGIAQLELLNDIGFLSVYSEAATRIAQSFISETRLDPLHSAETEQQLYNKLPGWLRLAQKHSFVECRLEFQNICYQTMIDANSLRAICASNIYSILNAIESGSPNGPTIACISKNLDEQFGFSEYAASRGILTRTLEHGHHARQSLRFANHLLSDDQQIYLIKQLPYQKVSDPLPLIGQHAHNITEQPTHILFGERAYPIEKELYIVRANDSDSDFQLRTEQERSKHTIAVIRKNSNGLTIESSDENGVTINDQKIGTHSQPNIGDCLRISDSKQPLIFIKVEQ